MMKKEISLGLILIVVLSLAGNALATRELWVRDLTGVNRWDNAWNKIDRLAAAQNIYAPGCVVQNPHTGEILVAVRSSNISTAEAILRYDQSSGAYLGLWTDLTDMEGQGPNNMTFGDDGDLYITGNSNIWKYDGISAAPKGASAGDPYLAHDASNLKSVAVKDGLVFTGRYGAGGIAYYDASTGAHLGTLVDASIPGSSGGPGVLIGPDGKLYSSNYSARVLQWDLSGGIGTFPTLTATVFVDGSSGGPDGTVLDKNSDLAWNTEDDWLSVMPDAEATIRSFYDDGVAPDLPWRFLNFSATDIDEQGWLGSPFWVDPNFTGLTPKNRGDVTEDLFVGADDLVRILTHWGESGSVPWENGDCAPYGDGSAPGDDFVGADDYVEVLTYWGTDYSSPEPAPEPATLGLMLLGGLTLLRRRR